MLIDTPFRKYGELIELIESKGISYIKISEDWQGNQIIATKGEEEVIITAGSHGDEHAGVVSAINLALESKYIVVPSRDPVGVNGFLYALSFLLDKEVKTDSYAEIISIIDKYADWSYRKGDFVVGLFGEIAVCAMPPLDPWEGEDEINEFLQNELNSNEKLREVLDGKRVIMPSNLPYSEGVGLFERAFTSFVIDGKVQNYNTLFDIPDEKLPEEFKAFKNFINKIRPKVVFDLHEGYGDKFYAFVPVTKDEFDFKYKEVFKRIKQAFKNNNLSYLRVEEAINSLPEGRVYTYDDANEIAVILHSGQRCRSLSCYSFRMLGAFSITFETGLKARFKERVLMSYLASKTSLNTLADLSLISK